MAIQLKVKNYIFAMDEIALSKSCLHPWLIFQISSKKLSDLPQVQTSSRKIMLIRRLSSNCSHVPQMVLYMENEVPGNFNSELFCQNNCSYTQWCRFGFCLFSCVFYVLHTYICSSVVYCISLIFPVLLHSLSLSGKSNSRAPSPRKYKALSWIGSSWEPRLRTTPWDTFLWTKYS